MCVVVQCPQYHHGLWHPIFCLGLWRGAGIALSEMLLPTASVFVKRLLGFRGQVLGGAVSLWACTVITGVASAAMFR
jgi:hypothetical protein